MRTKAVSVMFPVSATEHGVRRTVPEALTPALGIARGLGLSLLLWVMLIAGWYLSF